MNDPIWVLELPVGAVLVPTPKHPENSAWLVLDVNVDDAMVKFLNLETGHVYTDVNGDRSLLSDMWEVMLP